jgi:hypothetical protein
MMKTENYRIQSKKTRLETVLGVYYRKLQEHVVKLMVFFFVLFYMVLTYYLLGSL